MINTLGRELNDGTGRGLSFVPRKDGSGLYCAPDAASIGGAVGRLCRGWQPPARPAAALLHRIRQSCRYRRKNSKPAKVVKLRGRIVPKIKRKRARSKFKRTVFRRED